MTELNNATQPQAPAAGMSSEGEWMFADEVAAAPAEGTPDAHTAPAASTEAPWWAEAAEDAPGGPEAAPVAEAKGEAAPKTEEATAQDVATEILKVHGKELTLTKDELKLWAQKGFASQQSWEEAKRLRTEAESLAAANDPEAWFKAKGMDPIEWAAKQLIEIDRLERMTPAEKAAHEKEQRIRELEAAQKQREEQEQQKTLSEQTQAWETELKGTFEAALAQTSLPQSEQTLSTMATLYRDALKAGVEPSPAALARAAERQTRETMANLVGAQPDIERLTQLLGPKVIEAIRKHDVSRRMAKRKVTPPSDDDSTPAIKADNTSPSGRKVMTDREFMQHLLGQ